MIKYLALFLSFESLSFISLTHVARCIENNTLSMLFLDFLETF